MALYDEMHELFTTLGLSESAARVAAVGRYRSEAEAREQDLTDEADARAQDVDLTAAAEAVVPTVRQVLGMTHTEAREYLHRIHARERANSGSHGADRFVRTLADGLRQSFAVRERVAR
jgi:hypothetical protein